MKSLIIGLVVIAVLTIGFVVLTNGDDEIRKNYRVITINRSRSNGVFINVTLTLQNKTNSSQKVFVDETFFATDYGKFCNWLQQYEVEESLIPTYNDFTSGYVKK